MSGMSKEQRALAARIPHAYECGMYPPPWSRDESRAEWEFFCDCPVRDFLHLMETGNLRGELVQALDRRPEPSWNDSVFEVGGKFYPGLDAAQRAAVAQVRETGAVASMRAVQDEEATFVPPSSIAAVRAAWRLLHPILKPPRRGRPYIDEEGGVEIHWQVGDDWVALAVDPGGTDWMIGTVVGGQYDHWADGSADDPIPDPVVHALQNWLARLPVDSDSLTPLALTAGI